jgi:glycosyltransferase involved in cell wall biosynthesis
LANILGFLNPSEKQRVPVSVIIPAKNEARNIRRCLEHLMWAQEIFLVDSHSIDETIKIAAELGVHVAQFRFNGIYPKKKNWALENLPFRNEWILIVDADEVIPCDLAEEIANVLQQPNGYDGYYINRRFFFLGRWLHHCGYYPSFNLRLFKHRLGRYERMIAGGAGDNEVHEHVVLDGRAGYLQHDMLHFAYPDITTWVEKHNRYSGWEAELEGRFRSGSPEGDKVLGESLLQFKRCLKRIYLRIPLRFIVRFFYAYVWKKGFLDGKPGFIFCALLSFYDFLSWAKAYEKKVQREIS